MTKEKGYPIAKTDAQFFEDIENIIVGGNMTPSAWFQHLRIREGRFAGQPHLQAITILADIVYWYRPIKEQGKRHRKHFEGEILQQRYNHFVQKFGIPYEQVRAAIKYLEDEGVIFKDLHPHIKSKNGKDLGNVLFLGLDLQRLYEITTPLPESGRGVSFSQGEGYPSVEESNTKSSDKDYRYRDIPIKEEGLDSNCRVSSSLPNRNSQIYPQSRASFFRDEDDDPFADPGPPDSHYFDGEGN